MKIQTIQLFIILIAISSFAQSTKVLNNFSCDKDLQNKWNETIFKLQPLLNIKSTKPKKIYIKNDTLQLAKKILVKGEVHYNIIKFPLKKLVEVSFTFNDLVIYTHKKEIIVERYGYKKLTTSQITILNSLKKREGLKLILLFKQLATINRNRERL